MLTITIPCKGYRECDALCDSINENAKGVIATRCSPRHNEYEVIIKPTTTKGE